MSAGEDRALIVAALKHYADHLREEADKIPTNTKAGLVGVPQAWRKQADRCEQIAKEL